MHPKDIAIKDYTYTLPEDRVALFPLENRDDSKLLIYKDGLITEERYQNIAGHLPGKSLLVLNNTRVIQARILFQKPTGGVIEIFLLEPYEAISEYSMIMRKKACIHWKCMIGGASKWKEGNLEKKVISGQQEFCLNARLIEKIPDAYVVELSWDPAGLTFSEIMEHMGDTPLPPYLKRKASIEDKERYQTIYAEHDGSVAAPTAGLHFTTRVFESFSARNIEQVYVTLHVGAGTFKPVKAVSLEGHEMHAEWMEVQIDTISKIAENIDNGIVAVGTTSLRTLESLYWMGVKIFRSPAITLNELAVKQWDPYDEPLAGSHITAALSLGALLKWMQRNSIEQLVAQTQLMIAPGYIYRVATAIITNFHQPQSTLLLLVAAAIGNDWKQVYNYALENNFRFLSYGDGSLIFLPVRSAAGTREIVES